MAQLDKPTWKVSPDLSGRSSASQCFHCTSQRSPKKNTSLEWSGAQTSDGPATCSSQCVFLCCILSLRCMCPLFLCPLTLHHRVSPQEHSPHFHCWSPGRVVRWSPGPSLVCHQEENQHTKKEKKFPREPLDQRPLTHTRLTYYIRTRELTTNH